LIFSVKKIEISLNQGVFAGFFGSFFKLIDLYMKDKNMSK